MDAGKLLVMKKDIASRWCVVYEKKIVPTPCLMPHGGGGPQVIFTNTTTATSTIINRETVVMYVLVIRLCAHHTPVCNAMRMVKKYL